MKRFLAIVLASVVIFLAGAMVQEWEVFARPWFSTSPERRTVPDRDFKSGVETVHQYLTLSSHLYGTGGDRRFAERMPASANVVDEILREVEYLSFHGVVDEPSLQKMEILKVTQRASDGLEIHTKEYWVVRRHVLGRSETLDTRSYVVFNVYRLSRSDPEGWRIVAWDPEPPSPSQEGSQS